MSCVHSTNRRGGMIPSAVHSWSLQGNGQRSTVSPNTPSFAKREPSRWTCDGLQPENAPSCLAPCHAVQLHKLGNALEAMKVGVVSPLDRERCPNGVAMLGKTPPPSPHLVVEFPPGQNQALRIWTAFPVRPPGAVVYATRRARRGVPEMALGATHACNNLVHGGTSLEVVPLSDTHYEEIANAVTKAPDS